MDLYWCQQHSVCRHNRFGRIVHRQPGAYHYFLPLGLRGGDRHHPKKLLPRVSKLPGHAIDLLCQPYDPRYRTDGDLLPFRLQRLPDRHSFDLRGNDDLPAVQSTTLDSGDPAPVARDLVCGKFSNYHTIRQRHSHLPDLLHRSHHSECVFVEGGTGRVLDNPFRIFPNIHHPKYRGGVHLPEDRTHNGRRR